MPLNETFKDSTMAEVMYTVQKELRPYLDTDEAYPHVHALINFFGAMPMRVLVRSSFRHMVLKFCEYNLSEFDVLAVEEIISIKDGGVTFDRTAYCDQGVTSSTSLVLHGKAPAAEQRRGGSRNLSKPVRTGERVSDEYMEEYQHPEFFFNLPSRMNKLEDEHLVLKALFEETEAVIFDSYPTPKERAMLTDEKALRDCGVGDPRPYGGKPRTWEVRMPRPNTLRAAHTHTHTTACIDLTW